MACTGHRADAAGPVLERDHVPAIDRETALATLLDHWSEQGLDRFPPRNHLREEPFFLRQVMVDHHGVTWRYQAAMQGPTDSGYAEGFVDASSGEIVHSNIARTSDGGYLDPFVLRPPFWAVALVVLAAFVVTRRFSGKAG